jgi:hypothetical protein
MKKNYMKRLFLLAAAFAAIPVLSPAQCSVNMGTGSDGPYLASSNTTLAGGTYNFSSFTINAGDTVTVTGSQPLVIYCTGNVLINGVLNLSGGNGTDGITFSSGGIAGTAVAGGQPGGGGSFSSSSGPLNGINGSGTGGGGMGAGWSGGGGAGYAMPGDSSHGVGGFGGPAYGNPQISPVTGGSGGGGGSGGYDCGAGGGGGGGGYVSFSAGGTITIGAGGRILSNGGNGGSDGTGNCGGGGGGSGGSIVLLTNSTLTNNGTISATGGTGGASNVPNSPYYGTGANGSAGRIYMAYQATSGTGTISPSATTATILVVTITSTNVTCNGACNGAATANVTGGTAPYSYLWLPGGQTTATVSGLCPGTYTVTITDNSACTVSGTVTITEPAQLNSAASFQPVSCFGSCDGSLVSTVFGGTPGYTYNWMPGNFTSSFVSGVCAGTYTLTATDAGGCITTATTTVTSPTQVTVSVMQLNNVTCAGACNGTATIVPSGGTPGYSFMWSPSGGTSSSYNNLCAGTYTVLVTDANGCTASVTFSITEPAAMNAVTTAFGINCFGACTGTMIVSVTGGNPSYTYSWAPGGQTTATITNQCAGTYTVTSTDSLGCTTASTVTLTQPSQLTATASHTDETSAPANDGTATATASGGSPGYTYSWAPSGGTNATATGLDAGTYTCTITDAAGCTTTVTVTVGTQIGIDPVNVTPMSVNLFPNPAQEHVDIAVTLSQKANVQVELYNIVGEKMDAMDFANVNAVNRAYDVSHLANGVYFFRITSGNDAVTKKITVSH